MKKLMLVAVVIVGVFFLFGNQEKTPTIVLCDIYIDKTCLQDQAHVTTQIQGDVLDWMDIDDYQDISRTGITLNIRAIGNDSAGINEFSPRISALNTDFSDSVLCHVFITRRMG